MRIVQTSEDRARVCSANFSSSDRGTHFWASVASLPIDKAGG